MKKNTEPTQKEKMAILIKMSGNYSWKSYTQEIRNLKANKK